MQLFSLLYECPSFHHRILICQVWARGLGQGIMEYWNVEDPAYRGWELRIERFRD